MGSCVLKISLINQLLTADCKYMQSGLRPFWDGFDRLCQFRRTQFVSSAYASPEGQPWPMPLITLLGHENGICLSALSVADDFVVGFDLCQSSAAPPL